MSFFTSVVSKIPRRNRFHQAFESLHTQNFGELRVIECTELDPGNSYIDAIGLQIKCAPMKAPAFGRIDATLHFYFVPRRLVYKDWEEFITGGVNGTFAHDVTALTPVAPSFNFQELVEAHRLVEGSLCDDFSLPTIDDDEGSYIGIPPIDAMPFACYHKVFSDWYRDELLDPDEFEPLASEVQPNTSPLLDKRYRAWRKDYFTSARPDTQLGPSVGVPIDGEITASGELRA